MSTCTECGEDAVHHIANHMTCTHCGLENRYAPVFTSSYNNPSTRRPRAYYCRAKRFKNWFHSLNLDLQKHTEAILSLYTLIEFHWACRKKKRRYFFSRKVLLYYITRLLDLPYENCPLLKDEERIKDQLSELVRIRQDSGTCGW